MENVCRKEALDKELRVCWNSAPRREVMTMAVAQEVERRGHQRRYFRNLATVVVIWGHV